MGRGAADQSQPGQGVSPRQRPFAEAWGDLRTRLDNGITELGKLRGERRSFEERQRLATKKIALEDALSIYERLNETIVAGDSDYAGAWRSFTDAVERNHSQALKAGDDASASGFSVALSYQHGYGPDIDAPAPLPTR